MVTSRPFSFRRHIRKPVATAAGATAGAVTMYLLDPARGHRRRTIVRDKAFHYAHEIADTAGTTRRDLTNRARGGLARSRRLAHRVVTSPSLEREVQSALIRVSPDLAGIRVSAAAGRVTLSGPVPREQVERIRDTVRAVPGVEVLEDRLEVHERTTPQLLHQRDDDAGHREKSKFTQEHWSPTARFLGGVAGAGLAAYGLTHRRPMDVIAAAGGAALSIRAATNLPVGRLVGATGRRGVDIHDAIHVDAPIDDTWRLWENFEHFPEFMSHVRRVIRSSGTHSHWEVTGPAGSVVKWDAEITKNIPHRELAWKTSPGAAVRHAGRVRLDPQGSGTRITVSLSYNPVLGATGHALAVMLGSNPKQQLREDLIRMKRLLETRNHNTTITARSESRAVPQDDAWDPTDQRETIPEPDPEPIPRDQVSQADALDQSRTVRPTARYTTTAVPDEADAADALDQAREVVLDEEAEPHTAS